MSTIASMAEAARRELGSSFNGELIGPDDASYNEGRAVFNAMIDRRPALIVRPTDAASVSAAVGFGRSHDLPIAVRGGGHNGGGLGVVDDGIVIDLSSMDSVAVDPGVAHGAGRRRRDLGQGRRGDEPARHGDAQRHHLDDRRRRADAGRRHRPPRPRLRTEHRQPAGGRGRPGER